MQLNIAFIYENAYLFYALVGLKLIKNKHTNSLRVAYIYMCWE